MTPREPFCRGCRQPMTISGAWKEEGGKRSICSSCALQADRDQDTQEIPKGGTMPEDKIGTCSNCRFYSALENQCRAHPPITMPVMTPEGPALRSTFISSSPAWWCGEWKADRQ